MGKKLDLDGMVEDAEQMPIVKRASHFGDKDIFLVIRDKKEAERVGIRFAEDEGSPLEKIRSAFIDKVEEMIKAGQLPKKYSLEVKGNSAYLRKGNDILILHGGLCAIQYHDLNDPIVAILYSQLLGPVRYKE